MIDVPTRVKDALREGDRLKRYRFEVESDPVITIDNDHLVSESVTFDERMCSDKEIKFGLCEGTNLEFQYFGLPNITGKRLQAFIDVQYKDSDGELKWYEIPMGWFEVSESSRQASTGIIKVSAFNKLQSEYLDRKINNDIIALMSDPNFYNYGDVTLKRITQNMLCEYMEPKYEDYDDYAVSSVYSFELKRYSSDFDDSIFIRTGTSDDPTFVTSSNDIYAVTASISIVSRSALDFSELVMLYVNTHLLYMKAWLCAESIMDDDTPYYMGRSGSYVPFSNYNREKDRPSYPRYQYTDIYNEDFFYNDLLCGLITAYSNSHASGQIDTTMRAAGEEYHSPEVEGMSGMVSFLRIPCLFYTKDRSNPDSSLPADKRAEAQANLEAMMQDIVLWRKRLNDVESDIGDVEVTLADVESWSDVTLRDLQSSMFELGTQYGKLDRQTDLFSGVELNNSRLLPAEDLYPANDLYPNSIAERSNPAMYSKLWADEGNVRKFRYLIITYKGTETEGGQTREVEKTLQRTVDENGTDDYNMSNNWLFKNLVWTDEEVGDYAGAMVVKMQNLTWFPFEMWCAGLPYVETGDELEINVNGEAYTSYVLRRNLRGIQNLQDEMINGELDIF